MRAWKAPCGFIEILRSSPEAMLVFAGMAAVIALLFYLLLNWKIQNIEKLLTNHITETNGKIEELKMEMRENRKDLQREMQEHRKELKADAKENTARLEKKLDQILEKKD